MATSDRDLSAFVGQAIERGATREEIDTVLQKAGWTAKQIRPALAAFADVDFVLPVPRPQPYVSARDAFLYLVLFSTLGLSATYLGTLLFQAIDFAFPDPENPTFTGGDTIRWAIANLAVAAPLYLFLTWKTTSEVAKDPAKRASRVRRWLTYLALFLAAACIGGDLIVLVYWLLTGELSSTGLLLKLLVVGTIAGAIFRYYLGMASRDDREG